MFWFSVWSCPLSILTADVAALVHEQFSHHVYVSIFPGLILSMPSWVILYSIFETSIFVLMIQSVKPYSNGRTWYIVGTVDKSIVFCHQKLFCSTDQLSALIHIILRLKMVCRSGFHDNSWILFSWIVKVRPEMQKPITSIALHGCLFQRQK